MKILEVSSLVFPPYAAGGGVITCRLSKALAQRGHEVTVYTSDIGLDQDHINSLQPVQVCPFHSWLNLAEFLITPGIITEAKKKLRDFDIIHLQCWGDFQHIVIHHYAQKYGIPYVIDSHGINPRIARIGTRVLKSLYAIAFGNGIVRDASRCIAETEVGVKEYKDSGVNQDKIVSITPPFPVEEFFQFPLFGCFRARYNIKEKHVILFLGWITWLKGLDFLIESFHRLAQQRNDVILIIVGPDGGYKTSLEELIKSLRIEDKVLFTGFLGGEEKLSALVDADVVVQTSRYEQGTGVPFEAVLCNTPIIVSKNTGSSENVSRIDAGYLVEFGNIKELKDAMQKILDDPTEAINKAQKAKEYIIRNLSMEKNVEKYEKVYMDCIKEKQVNSRV